MYYLYDDQSEIYVKSDTQPTVDQYCISDIDFDLTLYRIIIGMLDNNKHLTYYTQKAKPAEQLAQQIISIKQSQQDTDASALDLDYRLTLLENNVKEGETE